MDKTCWKIETKNLESPRPGGTGGVVVRIWQHDRVLVFVLDNIFFLGMDSFDRLAAAHFAVPDNWEFLGGLGDYRVHI